MVDGEQCPADGPPARSQTRGQWRYRAQWPAAWGVFTAPVVTDEVHQRTMERIIWPTVKGMAAEAKHLYRLPVCRSDDDKQGKPGCHRVFNRRFGDPRGTFSRITCCAHEVGIW